MGSATGCTPVSANSSLLPTRTLHGSSGRRPCYSHACRGRRRIAMDPWYKVATPRKEVRDGRSFNPDEFAIALEQVVAGTAPEDYRDPAQFFARTCFTRALREHAGMVLRRLAGRTENTAPVLTLITQFGGGKTHTLTALYHLAKNGEKAAGFT